MKTTKFVCKTCKKEFETPKTVNDKMVLEGRGQVTYAVCPFCQSSGFEKKDIITKEQLKQYIYLKKEIEREKKKLKELKKSDKKYDDIIELIENNKLRCMALYLKLQSFIYSIDDSMMRQIFELRYIDGCDWSAVSTGIGGFLSEDYVRIAHDRFLAKYNE